MPDSTIKIILKFLIINTSGKALSKTSKLEYKMGYSDKKMYLLNAGKKFCNIQVDTDLYIFFELEIYDVN